MGSHIYNQDQPTDEQRRTARYHWLIQTAIMVILIAATV
jgi:hypothetical protein